MDIIFHMLVPTMLAMIAGVDKKKALLLAPIAVIPDLDTLLTAHRVYLHTVFIPIFIALVYFAYAQRRGLKPFGQTVFVGSLFYLSHLFLDFFSGPVAVLWPITSVGYGFYVSVTLTQYSITPVALVDTRFDVQQIPIPNKIIDVIAASPESIAVTLLFFFVLFVSERKVLYLLKRRGNLKQSLKEISEKREE